MNPTDLLKSLGAEGVGVSLSLKLEADAKPSDDARALIRDNRDALLEYLAGELIGSNTTRVTHLQHAATLPTPEKTSVILHGDLLKNLMVWLHRYHELRLEHPGGLIRNARPEHAAHHLTASAWAVLYDETHTILATAGDVPRHALTGKTELETIQPELMTAEKVVN